MAKKWNMTKCYKCTQLVNKYISNDNIYRQSITFKYP